MVDAKGAKPGTFIPMLRAVDRDGREADTIQAGAALVVRANGLRPATHHLLALYDDGGEILRQSVMSDAQGGIRDAVLWAQVGLDDPRSATDERSSVAELRRKWRGVSIGIEAIERQIEGKRATDRVVGKWKIKVSDKPEPLIVATDGTGRLLNGFETGRADANVALLDFPKGRVRVWIVPRQHGWQAMDAIRPAGGARNVPVMADIDIAEAAHVLVLGKANALPAGAYDFVARLLRPGYDDDDDLFLRPGDITTGRWSRGLVIREPFMASKVILGGCANLQQIAARRTQGGNWPYVQFTDTFQIGEDVWGTIDPNALDPSHTGKAAAIYVVQHKDAAGWTMDNSLSHLAVLGGNANVQKWVTQTYCANANLHLLWSAAAQVGDYDVVVDFGNNSTTLAGFVSDASYDMPLDMIDGYVVPGFRIVEDPTTATSFPFAGGFSYDSSTQGSATVTSDGGSAFTVPIAANVRFPADAAGATTPGQISAARASYPVVVLVHGNSGFTNSYQGYDYLLDHLALNGFIAASIHMQPGQQGTDRARMLQTHLPILFGMFGARAANNIGVMGHSRGGEAVVIAARLNNQEAWGWNFNAVVSLAPTNQYTFEHFGGAWAAPYLVIYGSLDGDLGGIGDTGFELYDHAGDAPKSMAFVYGACHDRFNIVWGDSDLYFGELTATDQAAVVSAATHQAIAKGYMAGFFRQHLLAEAKFGGIFRGEWVPAAVSASAPTMKIYTQYEDTVVRTVDNFEGAHSATSWQTSTIDATAGAVTASGLPVSPIEDELRNVDAHSPHLTGGLVLRWDTLGDAIEFRVPAGQRDVSGFQALSFRVGQRVNSASNPVGQAQDLRVVLTDGGGHSREIRVSKIAEIPAPFVRGTDYYTKSAMNTIRIPLGTFHIHCLNVDQVDLTDVVSLAFRFSEKATGELEIDSVQFTN
jgi:hypothetical protein